MIYFKFQYNSQKEVSNKRKSIFSKFAEKILTSFIPISNPDFSDKIDDVLEWNIEYNMEENCIEREIGLDNKNIVIVKMPFNNNYGFWLDTNAKIDDFKEKFNVEIITEFEFIKKWNELN
ncbi:hypothetical protein [Flavobacterium sp.]|uniref:hypothetical protein n=1 Tax=Flavobacterium sp. TaxID=239 RepID=UPI00286BFCEB|nr:hypothetical protein [Flavobacterium sp.]